MIKRLAILGSTGSIGRSTLDVVRRRPDRFKVVALAAGNNTALVKEQTEEFAPEFVSVLTGEAAGELRKSLSVPVEVGYGEEGVLRAAGFDGVDMAVAAISGAAGLVPTLKAIRAGKDIALANKETLVCAGPLVMEEVKKAGVSLLPVDSEHSAVFQALAGHGVSDVQRIVLTASGGPFLNLPIEELNSVTPEEALKHPRWSMGRKITVDSATMMNKGLEVIEARWLFGIDPDRISVVVHPQSIVHSLVEYADGSMVAQLGATDMRGPIAYALSYPERVDAGVPRLDLSGLTLEFSEPEPERYPCLALAYTALRQGGTMPAVLNAADEVAVDMFLKGFISFTDIFRVIREVFDLYAPKVISSLENVLEDDAWARQKAGQVIKSMI
jgi:1-deoxy-D-xylulose-5-phosphate reductoisomerase